MDAEDYMSGNDCRLDQGQGADLRRDLGQDGYSYGTAPYGKQGYGHGKASSALWKLAGDEAEKAQRCLSVATVLMWIVVGLHVIAAALIAVAVLR